MKILLGLLLALLYCPLAALAEESPISITPYIIDEKVKVGGMLKYEITIVNNGTSKADIYAVVNDISMTEGDVQYVDPAELDKTTSIARWLNFRRGVYEIMPGASTTVSLEIDIPSDAVPGKRFARIAFPVGPNREEAANGMANKSFAQLPINIEVTEEIIEKVQIKEFSSLSTVFIVPPAGFNVKLDNNGNKAVLPKGSVFIYNRRGEEVANIDVNPENEEIASEDTWTKILNWDEVKGFGKFKAKLEVEYGLKDKRDLQDTLYFWYFSWKLLAALFFATFILLSTMVILIFRKTYIQHHQEENARVQVRQSKAMSKKIVNLKK